MTIPAPGYPVAPAPTPVLTNYNIRQIQTQIRISVGLRHIKYTEAKWRRAVSTRKTTLGYRDWLADQIVNEFVEVPV